MSKSKNHGPQIKNDEQYEELRDQGYSKEKAARIANSDDAGKKGGKRDKYENRTKEDLYQEAKKADIEGRSKMSKDELKRALRGS